ncbi:hypothetical protein [Niabella ginsengisoli]|uniref:Uncharacterized protein n=1 Tax=Niabella ginsengisoli TaxID=522298 RepID=A0ABS9SKX7_9BACT|nr:hypothetical protein [Niabella ginsengisoli]MCH5599010.1 hypothetical protein [Niabella ginsengisoli]
MQQTEKEPVIIIEENAEVICFLNDFLSEMVVAKAPCGVKGLISHWIALYLENQMCRTKDPLVKQIDRYR